MRLRQSSTTGFRVRSLRTRDLAPGDNVSGTDRISGQFSWLAEP